MKRTVRHQPKHLRRGRRAAARHAAPGKNGDKGLVRLVVCAAIFILLVAVKLLFPQTVSNLARSAGRLIGRDADFQAAFAAVGRAISGEEDVGNSLQEAYTAVFNPTDTTEDGDAMPSYTAVKEVFASANRMAAYAARPLPKPETIQTEPVEEQDGEEGPAAEPAQAEEKAPEQVESQEQGQAVETTDDTMTTQALSYVYSMPALPENASLELRSLGFSYTSPLHGTLTSTFGWREHPIDGEEKFHYGLDLAADMGTDICAFADGIVYATGESSTLGNYIMLEHAGGYITLYAHCSRVTAAGGSVSMGDKIAEVGETGAATGPHLHFELHDGSLYLNPIYYVEVG